MKAFLDTHAAVALAEGELDSFGKSARQALERAALFYSPVVRFELAFLRESGKITTAPEELLDHLAANTGAIESTESLSAVVSEAIGLTWTRDPFDRMIVATAQLHRAPLITRDEKIRANFSGALW